MTSANWLDFLVFSDNDKNNVGPLFSQRFHLSGSYRWDVKEPTLNHSWSGCVICKDRS